MDLTRPVAYRGLNLNDATFANAPTLGIALESVGWPGVQGVGYTEKRSQADGFDASDVYLGLRRLLVHGTVYGRSRAELFDKVQQLREACSPTAAFTDEPGSYGYLPLTYDEPTLEVADFTNGFKPLQVFVRPVQTPALQIVRDSIGGVPDRGGAIAFDIGFEAKDPRIYVRPEATTNLTGTTASGNLRNRGDYPAPLNGLFVIPAANPAGLITVNVGGSQMQITVPDSAAQQTIRYDGTAKILTVEENGLEVLRMDLLKFLANTTYPLVPPGLSAWSWSSTAGAVGTGSRLWFWESFA